MSHAEPAALIMARAPRRGEVHGALEPVLGAARCLELRVALIGVAARWARGVAPAAVHVAYEPPDAGPEIETLIGFDATLFPQSGEGIPARVAGAAARVFASGDRPLLIVWPELPRLKAEHASAALDDLTAGCDVVLGPVIDGGLYLLGIKGPLPKLFALPEATWRNADVMMLAIAAAREAGLEIGVLRVERALHRPADVGAALADPLLPDAIARVLRGGGPASNLGQLA